MFPRPQQSDKSETITVSRILRRHPVLLLPPAGPGSVGSAGSAGNSGSDTAGATTDAVDPVDPADRAVVPTRTDPAIPVDPADPVDNTIRRLLREWNPDASLPYVAEGIRWVGPVSLTPRVCAEAGLPGGWGTAYAAVCARSRVRVPDGLDASLLRLRYPHGLPAGDEALAWSLVTGLARRLGGATRLPGGTLRATRGVAAQRARAQENSYCVYGHEALPWSVLRSVLCLSLPDLDRNGASAANDYCLDRPGGFEVRVRPFDPRGFVPFALRAHADAEWPGTVYRFHCLPQATDLDAARIDAQLRGAACQLADVVGGFLLDGEGFPLAGVSRAYSAV